MSTVNETIEQLIDTHGLNELLHKIADISREKAQHIRENWQDTALARKWDIDAKRIERTANNLNN